MISYTPENRADLQAYLDTHEIAQGLGDKESACTLAAINIAMTGKRTHDIPECMSESLGRFVIVLQGSMSNEMRNSARYKRLVVDMPGTGRGQERERADIALEWMWSVVLPELQALADKGRFGAAWRNMLDKRTPDAAADAAKAAAYAGAYAVDVAAHVAYAARAARSAAADAARAAEAGAHAAAVAARTAHVAYAARAAYANAHAAAADVGFRRRVDLIGVLERMTHVGETRS